jgi:hypothetical protein
MSKGRGPGATWGFFFLGKVRVPFTAQGSEMTVLKE